MMSLQENIKHQITENIQTQQILTAEKVGYIEFAAQKIVDALLADRKILCCGHAGSIANAQYFVSLMVNRFSRERPSLPAISLVNDVQMISTIASIQNYDEIYAKQLRALGQASDILLIYYSDGGTSNLIKLINAAHDKALPIILFSGENDDSLEGLLRENDICICVPSQVVHRVNETQMLMTHCVCDLVDSQLFGNQLI
jgi:D-sedoheptulose 7-phosphate isomerase